MKLTKYRRYQLKCAIIIVFLFLFAIVSTYLIYQKFSKLRDQDYDAGQLEVVFHEKNGNQVDLLQFTPVTDAVGLSTTAYNFTVSNTTPNTVSYKITMTPNEEKMLECGCSDRVIPSELLKISFRKDHLAPIAMIYSESQDGVIYEDTLESNESEDYSIRVWPMTSNFIVDRTSHFHAVIEVVEE